MLCLQSSLTRPKLMKAAWGIGTYDRKFEHLSTRNVTISNVLLSYKYFHHVEEELRRDFTFKPNVTETARRWLNDQVPDEWKDMEFVRVVIHVRRTDRARPENVERGFPLATAEYFRQSMSYFTDCLERVQFVVLSDDPAWCRQHIHATNIVYSSGHSPIVDLAIASLCDHAITTIGTYSWWVAWFANGVTITQKNFPTNGSWISSRWRRADYFKPDWIAL